MNFSYRLGKAIKDKNNPSVLGLDPKLEYIPESIKEECRQQVDNAFQAAARSILEFNKGLLMPHVTSFRPLSHVAYYEMYGIEGLRALGDQAYGREKG